MVILSEVLEPIKQKYFVFLLALLPSLAGAGEPSLDRLSDCNWMVTYRGRTYDLSPLTREALARPIESDIRFALQRVPAANEHLNAMGAHLRDARAHTILASIFLGGFLTTRILRSSEKNPDLQKNYDAPSYATGLFFLAATAFSWKSTHEAKSELIEAVRSFNEESPHKIEPAAENQALILQ